MLLALSPIAVTYTAGFIALLIGCDLNEASEHPCPLLGVNVGPLLYGMGLAVWFVSLTVLAGFVALVVLAHHLDRPHSEGRAARRWTRPARRPKSCLC